MILHSLSLDISASLCASSPSAACSSLFSLHMAQNGHRYIQPPSLALSSASVANWLWFFQILKSQARSQTSPDHILNPVSQVIGCRPPQGVAASVSYLQALSTGVCSAGTVTQQGVGEAQAGEGSQHTEFLAVWSSLPLTGLVTLGKTPYFSDPECPYL